MRTASHSRQRKGHIAILSAFLIVVMFALLAFAIDLGYLQVAKTELQRTADAAAIAATWELIAPAAKYTSPCMLKYSAMSKARDYTLKNPDLKAGLQLSDADVTVGYMANPSDPTESINTTVPYGFNTVRVSVRQDGGLNSRVPFFFAPVLGVDSASCKAEATAAFLSNFSGFQTPKSGENLQILPFALDLQTWNKLMSGQVCDDDWSATWDKCTKKWIVKPGCDGIKEVNLFPQGTGSPGNRGTVDIGSSNNSTCDIARQIVHGISPADMEYMGGKLEFNADGVLNLNGDTGISAGVKDELTNIIGQPRIIPLFQSVTGPGNNAEYAIVKFVGVRILEVKLTGCMSSKRVIIQPATVKTKGGIPSTGPQQTNFVYSPVWLVR